MRGFKNGFTLAEVLITLAIIGIVAALTIPTVVRNYQEKQTVTQVKKFHSVINQAFNQAQLENGHVTTWDLGGGYAAKGAENIANNLKKYLRITKYCGNGNKGECLSSNAYKTLNGTTKISSFHRSDPYVTLKLADGMSMWTYTYGKCESNYCSNLRACGEIGVDINGPKKPNTLGKDVFLFYLTPNGIRPWGLKCISWGYPFSESCNISKSGVNNGAACSAWVIEKENLDYLKSPVSW